VSDRRELLFQRILARIEIDIDTGCWIWTGPDSGTGRGGGYGRMSIDGGTMAVHIVMWIIRNGPIPPRKQIDHECSRRKCCNPEHLMMVTHLKNQRLRAKRAKAVKLAVGKATEEVVKPHRVVGAHEQPILDLNDVAGHDALSGPH
jgi:hypothetical protein